MKTIARLALLASALTAAGCNLTYDREGLEFSDGVGDVEPNDTTATALPLTLGTPVTGQVGSDSDLDYYAFTVPPGGREVRFMTWDAAGTGCASMDPEVRIFDSNGALMAGNDDTAAWLCSDLVMTLAPGSYYVEVSHSEAASTFGGPYGYRLTTAAYGTGQSWPTVSCDFPWDVSWGTGDYCEELNGTFDLVELARFESDYCRYYGGTPIPDACPDVGRLVGYCDVGPVGYGVASTSSWYYEAAAYTAATAQYHCEYYNWSGIWVSGGTLQTVSCDHGDTCDQYTGTLLPGEVATIAASCAVGTFASAACPSASVLPGACDLGSYPIGTGTTQSTRYYAPPFSEASALADCVAQPGTWVPEITLGAVEPLLGAGATLGDEWNEWLSGSTWQEAAAFATACDAFGAEPCVNGGELRRLRVSGVSNCAGLTAVDQPADAFDWVCSETLVPGQVWFVSTGLKPARRLADLLDGTPAWRAAQVTVSLSGMSWSTPATVWWSNPVAPVGAALLTTEGGVYVADGVAFNGNLAASAHRISLVLPPPYGAYAPVSAGMRAVSGTGVEYLWLEGELDASGTNGAVHLIDSRRPTVRSFRAWMPTPGATQTGVLLDRVTAGRFDGLTLSGFPTGIYVTQGGSNELRSVRIDDDQYYGLSLQGTAGNRVTGLTVRPAMAPMSTSAIGVYLDAATNNALSALAIEGQFQGVYLAAGSTMNRLSDVSVAGSLDFGIGLSGVNGNSLTGLRVTNNGGNGLYLNTAHRNALVDVVALGNSDGVQLNFSNDNRILGVTASRNTGWGVWFMDSNANLLASAAVFLNFGGIRYTRATGNLLADAAFTDQQNVGLYGEQSSSVAVTGQIRHGFDMGGACMADATSQGFSDLAPSCGWNPPSGTTNPMPTVIPGVTLTDLGSVVGDAGEDLLNGSDSFGLATLFELDDPGFDWFLFDTPHRAWVRAGGGIGRLGCTTSVLTRSEALCGAGWIGSARIFDAGLRVSSNQYLFNALGPPESSTPLSHTWSDATSVNYFAHARELVGDGFGNDDGLCDLSSTERCAVTPNIGAYQGHGGLGGSYLSGGVTFFNPAANGY